MDIQCNTVSVPWGYTEIARIRRTGNASGRRQFRTSFEENAALKARYYATRSGLLAVADDSGISVAALNGAPGLYSSRFGGEGATDADRNRLLIEKLKGVPREKRGARFTSAVALARAGEVVFQVSGVVEGLIAEAPMGANGFGYDPLFFYPPFGRTFGEVSRVEKDKVSHRGKAFARLRAYLSTTYFAFLSGRSPTTAFCAAISSWMPLSAEAISCCSSSSLKGVCSAVPWISTNRPRPVLTTFMSTSAFESSS